MKKQFQTGALRRGLSAALHLAAPLCFPVVVAAQADDVIRERFTMTLGEGFVTTAEYVRPARAAVPMPAVLLVHGATPADLDFTIERRAGDTTRVLRDIAEGLAQAGIASLRYNKRWVSGPGEVNMAGFMRTDLQALLADARTMLGALRDRSGVDTSRIYVWGWSEGSAIVTQLAAQNTGVAGVIAHAPVYGAFHETLGTQFERIGLPYLLEYADADSTLTLDALTRAEQGSGGLLARSQASMLLDPFALQRGVRRLSPLVDTDSSGRIHLERDALAVVRRFFTDGPMLGMYSSARALPGLLVMLDSITVPLLVLHGDADANIDIAEARSFNALVQGREGVRVLLYERLGHSLGFAEDALRDDFRSVDPRPIRDAAAWILARPPER